MRLVQSDPKTKLLENWHFDPLEFLSAIATNIEEGIEKAAEAVGKIL